MGTTGANHETAARPLRAGDPVPVARVRASSRLGTSGRWLADGAAGDVWIEYDFGGAYPIREMHVWNYDQRHPGFPELWRRGLRFISVEHSPDGRHWTPLAEGERTYELPPAYGPAAKTAAGAGGANAVIRWNGERARFVRIRADLNRDGFWGGLDEYDRYAGLNAVRFIAEAGWAAEPREDWSALFRRGSGWTGSDGIYSIPVDGRDTHGGSEDGKTLLLFGDTFVGEVDPESGRRLSMTMINNSMALLDGAEPEEERMRFLWNDADPASPRSSIEPATPAALAVEGSYYWLQDGASVGGMFYCFPMIIGPNPDGPEGFQFALHGVTICRAPMTPEGPDLSRLEQFDAAPLHGKTSSGHLAYYGAAVMPLTMDAGVPEPDGYVYVYGLLHDGHHRPVAARALPEHLADVSRWTFWNGAGWSRDAADAVPIAEETSPEYSVHPMRGGPHHGKYVLTYLRRADPKCVVIRLGRSPVGPFGEEIALYACPEQHEGGGRYVYNAKAHPGLSKPGELLVSYNVNTTKMDEHVRFADIYRPRFVNVRWIGKGDEA